MPNRFERLETSVVAGDIGALAIVAVYGEEHLSLACVGPGAGQVLVPHGFQCAGDDGAVVVAQSARCADPRGESALARQPQTGSVMRRGERRCAVDPPPAIPSASLAVLLGQFLPALAETSGLEGASEKEGRDQPCQHILVRAQCQVEATFSYRKVENAICSDQNVAQAT